MHLVVAGIVVVHQGLQLQHHYYLPLSNFISKNKLVFNKSAVP